MPTPRRLGGATPRGGGGGGGVGILVGPSPSASSSAAAARAAAPSSCARLRWRRRSAGLLVAFGFGALAASMISTANVLYFASGGGGGGPRDDASHSAAAVVSPENLLKRVKEDRDREKSDLLHSTQKREEREQKKPAASSGKDRDREKSAERSLSSTQKRVHVRGQQEKKPASSGGLSSELITEEPVVRKPYDYAAAAEREPRDFEPNPHAVIVTKIHGDRVYQQLRQSLCLLHVAYNSRPLHDIVVFTTEPISTEQIDELKTIVHPANIRVIFDELTLEEQFKSMTDAQRTDMMERCNVTSTDDINWHTRCREDGARGIPMPIAYSWMAEFRSKYLWRHPALEPYKYMFWYDSDAFAARVWEQDPVAFAIRNDLVVLTLNFPQGRSYAPELQDRIVEAYGEAICFLKLGEEGHIVLQQNVHNKTACPGFNGLPLIHGFFHITSLDFYRNEENLRWNDILIGDSRFSRKFDDQVQVTVPAAVRAPERAWDMNSHGLVLDVWHNKIFDGRRKWRGKGYFVKYWAAEGKDSFPEASGKCGEYIVNAG